MRSEMEQRGGAALAPLTGLLNRKALAARFDEITEQAAATGGSVCLLACDLDKFKAINDAYGHDRGDAVLRETADVMRRHLRSFELAYRLGGEEFLVVLPGSSLPEGQGTPAPARVAIERATPAGLAVTVSTGVAAASGAAVTFETLFR